MKITRKVLIVAAITLLVVTAVVIKILSPIKAVYVSPQKRHLVQEVFGTGTVEARVLVTAGSKITGRVKKLYVDQGAFVKKGQLLALLESEDLQALVTQAVTPSRKAFLWKPQPKATLHVLRQISKQPSLRCGSQKLP